MKTTEKATAKLLEALSDASPDDVAEVADDLLGTVMSGLGTNLHQALAEWLASAQEQRQFDALEQEELHHAYMDRAKRLKGENDLKGARTALDLADAAMASANRIWKEIEDARRTG